VGKLFDDQVDYAAGLYFFEEDFKEYNEGFSSVGAFDQNGVLFGPALPYTLSPLPASAIYPLGDARRVKGDSESKAAYSQLTWRPAAFDSKLAATLGLRYTEDRKNASRLLFNSAPDNTHSTFSSDNFSPTVTLDYTWAEDISTYVKWANGYRAGGFNVRSTSFREYGEEELESLELGWKTLFFDRRLRINGAIFKSEWRDAQLDFSDPVIVTLSETINATTGETEIEGLEIDITWVPTAGLTLSADYQYLDWDFPAQRNPLSNQDERFVLIYAPKSTAAVNINYEFSARSFGTLSLNLNATYSDNFYHTSKNFEASGGATLLNARALLADIPAGGAGTLEMALWGKNLSDEEYVNFSIVTAPSLANAYGTPRTFGIDFTYRYN
jgi:iron complex outermembrane receptor protein